jgi:hypothetical protein
MRQRRETVEHPFGTIKARMGATHFLMMTLPRVASEMALHVLAYNLTRVIWHRSPGRLPGRLNTRSSTSNFFSKIHMCYQFWSSYLKCLGLL